MKLKKLEVSAFGGINPNSPVVIDFTQSKSVNISGDNGVNKTSLLNSLLVACGQLSKENKNFVNNESGKIDINFTFVGKDRCNYEVHCTKSKFSLTYEGEAVAEPITKMKDLLGVVGVSPMSIKDKPLKEIVKWLASYSNKSAEEFDNSLLKFKNGIKSARDTRAQANKSAKAITEYLADEPLFNNWEQSEKKYTKSVDIKELSASLDVAGRASDRLLQAESKVKQQRERKQSIDNQIQQLQSEQAEIDKSIKGGEKFIEENKDARKEYDRIKTQYDNAANEVVAYNKWQDIKKKKKEKDELETISQQADSKEKEILQSLKELQAEILPDIKGVELVTEDTHENGVSKKEGLYWNGVNAAQMSESEFWKLVMEIWRKYKVKIVVIDNFQSLGSMAVEVLEKLSNDGCYILTAEMKREQKSIQITYE